MRSRVFKKKLGSLMIPDDIWCQGQALCLKWDIVGVFYEISKFGPAINASFSKNIFKVILYGIRADKQFLGDLFVSQSQRDVPSDVFLSLAQFLLLS